MRDDRGPADASQKSPGVAVSARKLHVAPGLTLDADYVAGGTVALLAKKGAGKSYAARVLCEEFWDAKIPFVLLDPMGTSWGLRAAADGSAGGLPVPIFGGDHGDAPLERTGGALIADLVVEEGLSMILDLSGLGTRAGERQFAHDFFQRLYRTNRELVHLLVDEADLFAPQKPQPGDAPLLGITENIVRRGRNKGIGITLITQRPAVLNKDVLTQVDALVAMRITGLQDRNAIDAWVMGHGDQEAAAEVKGTLAGLANGEGWWWIPELNVLKRVTVRASRTFDSSPTKTTKGSQREPKSLADIDMGAIETKMAATIERARADDPKELRQRIAALEKQVREQPGRESVERVVEVPVEVSMLTDEDRLLLAQYQTAGDLTLTQWRSEIDKIDALLKRIQSTLHAPRPTPPPTPRPALSPTPRPRAEPRPQDNGEISGPQQRILDAIAWLDSINLESGKVRLAFLAGYSPNSGGYANLLGKLRSSGYIDYPSAGQVALTETGRQAANEPEATPTTQDLQAKVMSKLKPAQQRVLQELIDQYPSAMTREELAVALDYSPTSGGFANLLGSLRTLGLIDYPGTGNVLAEPVLFL